MSLVAKDLNDSVFDRLQNALNHKYLIKGTVKPPPPPITKPDNTPVENLAKQDVDDIVTAQIARKWGGSEFTEEEFFTVVAGEKLESLIESLAGLKQDVKELLTKYRNP